MDSTHAKKSPASRPAEHRRHSNATVSRRSIRQVLELPVEAVPDEGWAAVDAGLAISTLLMPWAWSSAMVVRSSAVSRL